MRGVILIVAAAIFVAALPGANYKFERREKLSEYNFFRGKISELLPGEGVIPYGVNSPLFSNYAEKARFVKIPDGAKAVYNDSASFDFPIGTVLIKNFYYPSDFRKPAKGKMIIETRLLVNEENGWQAYPYIWNDEQTDAIYDPAGETKTITFVNRSGKKVSTVYAIPNKNQCKGCHISNGKMMPIGTTSRQLNGNFKYASETANQLEYWKRLGLLKDANVMTPALARWEESNGATLNDRARSYLDANCGHCHSRKGPASTSGLFLDIFETDPGHLGVNKAPVAAGRGAGDLKYDIEPGAPNRSILVFRMKTTDPAIAMPEIGREQIHTEGVQLIEEWIRKNDFSKKLE